jgi:hypothetical protein
MILKLFVQSILFYQSKTESSQFSFSTVWFDIIFADASFFSPSHSSKRHVQKIMSKYVNNGAPMQVNISDIHVTPLRQNVANGNISIKLFDDVQSEIRFIMETDCLSRFQKDPLYEEARTVLREIRGYCSPIEQDNLPDDGLTVIEFEILRKLGTRQQYSAEDVILQEGSFSMNLILLESGVLELSHLRNGKNEVFAEVTVKDAIVEEYSLLGTLRSSMTITAKSDETRVIFVKACYLQTLLKSYPETSLRFYRATARKFATILHNHYLRLANPTHHHTNDPDWNRTWYRINSDARVNSSLEHDLLGVREHFPSLMPSDVPVLSV